jgi:hypothetical protein
MTASVGREVDANLLPGAALGSAQARANPQDAGRQDLGDLVQSLGGGHEVGAEGVRHGRRLGACSILAIYRRPLESVGVSSRGGANGLALGLESRYLSQPTFSASVRKTFAF